MSKKTLEDYLSAAYPCKLKEYVAFPVKELMELLPGRSKASITGRKHVLGISTRKIHKWTEEEIAILRNNPEMTAKELRESYFQDMNEDMINRARIRYSCSRNTKWEEDRVQLFCSYIKMVDVQKFYHIRNSLI